MARNCGSWISCVLLSPRIAFRVALGIVTEKLWLFRCVSSFSVGELVVEVGVVVPFVLLLVVVLDCGACSPMLKLFGGNKPKSWARSRLTCKMRTSTTTSGGALS